MLTLAKRTAVAIGLGAMMVTTAPAMADPPPWAPAHGRRAHDEDRRRWRHYDHDRYPPGYSAYYADRYYRSGYRPIPVTRETRIYRGYDGRYYCRRSDGTTGLIIGAALGGLIGNSLDRGRSSLAGTLIGAGAGALLGREIDRGELVCR
ncbi:MAG TPA: glycine zipper 2TM domain-containing protein [Sphingobium sp.]|nr:glycine zipper 2TM domain-containing protein [Sphingobium sp.]